MRTETPQIVRLQDYRPSDFLIDKGRPRLQPSSPATRVTAKLALQAQPGRRAGAPLVLDGDELILRALALDGRAAAGRRVRGDAAIGSTITAPPRRPVHARPSRPRSTRPRIPSSWASIARAAIYCTQCEAEGFRRITYFLDRPDVLSVYTTRIEAERDEAPVLLGNGNPVESGDVPATTATSRSGTIRTRSPSYLFALVGGRLGKVGDASRP